MRTGLTDPLRQRPLVAGLPWQQILPWDSARLIELAEATESTPEDLEERLRDFQPPPQHPEERHRFLLVDNPSLE
eukprot:251887-Pyramimonas_sp.AAC.1